MPVVLPPFSHRARRELIVFGDCERIVKNPTQILMKLSQLERYGVDLNENLRFLLSRPYGVTPCACRTYESGGAESRPRWFFVELQPGQCMIDLAIG